MTNIINLEQEQIDRVVEALRTSTGTIVFKAFHYAPTENLMHMRDMIIHILENRDDVKECECGE